MTSSYGIPTSPAVALKVSLTNALNLGTPLLADPTSSVRTTANSAISGTSIPSIGVGTTLTNGITYAQLGLATTALGGATSALVSFASHTGSHITNFGQRAGLANASINLNETLASTGTPCTLMNSFFGSILGAGAALIGAITSAVNAVASAIAMVVGGAVAAMNAAIAAVNAAVTSVLNMISSELAAIASWTQKLLNSALASLLSVFNFGPVDSCLKSLVGAVSTGAAAAIFAAH
jgi:hypothetical protein